MVKVNKEAVMQQKVLHELLGYDSATGGFVNNTNRNSRARKGQSAGYVNDRGYVVIGINGHPYQAHRLAWVHDLLEISPLENNLL